MKLGGKNYNSVITDIGAGGFLNGKFVHQNTIRSVSVSLDNIQPSKKKKPKKKIGAGVLLSESFFEGFDFKNYLSISLVNDSLFVFFSFLKKTKTERGVELEELLDIFKRSDNESLFKKILVLDFSRIEKTVDENSLSEEINEYLKIASSIKIPLAVEVSVSFPPDLASLVLLNTKCEALFLAGSISWEDFPQEARKVFFQSSKSSMFSQDGGSVYGKYLLPLIAEWVRQVRKKSFGMKKPIVTMGGVLRPRDIEILQDVEVSGIVLDSALFKLRPWNVSRVITKAQKLFGDILKK